MTKPNKKFDLKAELRKERGLAARIAEALDIRPSAIAQWEQVPIKRVKLVSKLLNVPKERLRPDVY